MSPKEEPIILRTFGDLIRHGCKLTGFCRRCSVHKAIDLGAVRPDRVCVGARFKCRACGGAVEVTLSPVETGGHSDPPALEKWRER
tara:strand:+ start:829 stop:1086 length:258 start_codon:yes stop_codon:yes gene_type:complete